MIDFTICENVDNTFLHFTAAMFLILSEAKFTDGPYYAELVQKVLTKLVEQYYQKIL